MTTGNNGQLLVSTAAIEPTDIFMAGLRYSSNGVLRVTTATPTGNEPILAGWRRTNEGVAFVEIVP